MELRFQAKPTEQYHVCLGAVGVSRRDERRFAASLLDAIVGGSASSRLYIPSNLWPDVKERLVADVDTIKMGDPADFENFMGAVIDADAFKTHSDAIAEARTEGAEILTGGTTDDSEGYFVEPTVIATEDKGFRLLRDELFAAAGIPPDDGRDTRPTADYFRRQGQEPETLIAELDTMIAEQFRTTFLALETAFERRFEQLFGGGFARLSLTDPTDLGSTGVTATSSIEKASGAAKRSPSPEVQPITRLMSPKSLRSGINSIVAR